MNRGIDIVVPVLRGLDASRPCLEAAVRTGARVIAVCDPPAGSTDLDLVAIRNEAPLGFAGCANRGILLRNSDVLLIDGESVLPDGRLRAMADRLDSSDRIASVSAPGICVLIRSWVLNAAGSLDPSRGDDALREWSERASRLGMRHVELEAPSRVPLDDARLRDLLADLRR